MRVTVITPPAPVVTWEEADARLRLASDVTQQADVEAMIAAATAHLDGPGGWLGRALGPQTLEVRLDSFDRWRGCYDPVIRLPFPPLIDVLSAKYLDGEGVEQTLATDAYEVRGVGGYGEIAPVYNASWPSARWQAEAVRIRYRAGYAEDPEADTLVPAVPGDIKAAILLLVGDMIRFRETGAIGTVSDTPAAKLLEGLLSTKRVFA